MALDTGNGTGAVGKQAPSCIGNENTEIPSPAVRCPHSSALFLPPEVLFPIFLDYARSLCREGDLTYRNIVPYWINVSYVCRYWRDVALECAQLWAHLFFVSSPWMDELLKRSKTSPLTICALMNFMDHEGTRLVKKALQYLDRTQTICIECSSKVALKFVLYWLHLHHYCVPFIYFHMAMDLKWTKVYLTEQCPISKM